MVFVWDLPRGKMPWKRNFSTGGSCEISIFSTLSTACFKSMTMSLSADKHLDLSSRSKCKCGVGVCRGAFERTVPFKDVSLEYYLKNDRYRVLVG